MNEASGLTPPGVAWPASLSLSSSMDPSLKPRLRGVSHQFAFFVSVVLGAGLVASASGAGERAAAAVFGAAVAAMFGVSALYHRVTWRPRASVDLGVLGLAHQGDRIALAQLDHYHLIHQHPIVVAASSGCGYRRRCQRNRHCLTPSPAFARSSCRRFRASKVRSVRGA
jgi:hypothetical protein